MRKKISQRAARNLQLRVEELEQRVRSINWRVHDMPGAVGLGSLTMSEEAAWLGGRLEGAKMCGHTLIVVHRGWIGQSAKLDFYAVDTKVKP